MHDNRIFFWFNIDIPEIDKGEPDAKTSIGEHRAELTSSEAGDVHFKVFFDPKERLDRKIMGRETDYSYTLLSRFRVVRVASSFGDLLNVDFGDYEHIGMESSTGFYESGLQYFTVRAAGIKLIFKSEQQLDSEVYLNGTAFGLVELNYKYAPNLPWRNSEFKWQPENKVAKPIDFNDVQFTPEHHFYSQSRNSSDAVILQKEPRLKITHQGIKANEVLMHANILCSLYSFYTNKEVTWKTSKIYAEGKFFYETRKVVGEDNEMVHGLFIWDFLQNPLNLIRNVNARFLVEKGSLVIKMIERFNYALKLRDESKFMILYGLLEELRNQYIVAGLIEKDSKGNPNRVREEYNFMLNEKEVDKAIERALETVVPIVSEGQQDLFRMEIKLKVFGVKVLSMTNQFTSYFEFINISPEASNLNFAELKSLRDKIFHGRSLSDTHLDILRKAIWNPNLPRFIGILLLKFLGIENLDKIEKTRP